ncbi:hypothetical protein KC362_g83 [Hortaea werneckii]|nr:hypothetical protein KC362_g83 [Hortaea werneckii]
MPPPPPLPLSPLSPSKNAEKALHPSTPTPERLQPNSATPPPQTSASGLHYPCSATQARNSSTSSRSRLSRLRRPRRKSLKVEVLGLAAAAAPVAPSSSVEDGVADEVVIVGLVLLLAAATEEEVAIAVFELVPAVAFASSESDATQVSEPTFTVLSGFASAVCVTMGGTGDAFEAAFVYREPSGTVIVVLVRPLPAPPARCQKGCFGVHDWGFKLLYKCCLVEKKYSECENGTCSYLHSCDCICVAERSWLRSWSCSAEGGREVRAAGRRDPRASQRSGCPRDN